jgi:hypothetical protein
MFGTRDQVDPVRRLIGAASAWGGNPEKDATYLNVTPPRNDGRTVYRFAVEDVPVEAFWSISVYDAKGYYRQNPYNAYSLNSMTAKKNTDGTPVRRLRRQDRQLPAHRVGLELQGAALSPEARDP